MENMERIVLTACILGVMIEIADCLKPEKFTKQLRTIFSLIFISGIIFSAANVLPDLELPEYPGSGQEENFSDAEKTAERLIKERTAENLSAYIGEMLRSQKISYKKISCDINITPEGSISINRIDYSGSDFSRARRAVLESFPETEVKNIG